MDEPKQFGNWALVKNFERSNVLGAIQLLADNVYDAIETNGYDSEDFILEIIMTSRVQPAPYEDLSKYSVGIRTKMREAQK